MAAIQTTVKTFQIDYAKLYVSVVSLSLNDDIKFLEKIKQAFKRTISWNKRRSEIKAQPKNSNLDDLVDPIFTNINRLFSNSFKNGNHDPKTNYFLFYYMPLIEINDFNALIDNKPFFDQPVTSKQEACQEMMTIQKEMY